MNIQPFKREYLPQAISHLLTLPQADCEVQHGFAPGMYIRQVTIKAGVFAIGHYQKTEHLNMMLSGRVTVFLGDEEQAELVAPMMFTSQPGRKVGLVTKEMTWLNIYSTNETDVDVLESMFMEPDERLIAAKLASKTIRQEDIDDFRAVILGLGVSKAEVRQQSEISADLIPFPYGMYKCKVGASSIEGRGLIATANIQAGEIICPASIKGCRTPAGRYANHAANHNSVFLKNGDTIDLMATRHISGCVGGLDGEEITVDYRQARSL